MARIFVDTNVLFPFSIMDLLLALSEDAVHTVMWTDTLLDEWERVVVNEHKRTPETSRAITAAIREFFADSKVERADYEHLIDEMPGRDPDDHHHSAAAIVAGASVLLTQDRAGFPARPLARRGLRVIDPDTYLCEVADELADEVDATIIRLSGEKRRPPKTPRELLDDLARAGVPRFAAKLLSPSGALNSSQSGYNAPLRGTATPGRRLTRRRPHFDACRATPRSRAGRSG